jgi:hypothetical protein
MKNRIGKYYDGSEARKDFIKNRVKNHLKIDSLGIEEHKLKELKVYFNGAIEEPNDKIVHSIKEIMRDEFDKLGLQTDYLLGEFEIQREAYQAQRKAFYRAFNDVATLN